MRISERRADMQQLTIFDADIETDRRPCRYKFHRYVGQKVSTTRHGICTIRKINDSYYTYLETKDGELIMGTPYDMAEITEEKDG
jgi:hypothetical protein